MNSTSDPPLRLTFGRFRVFPERREVLADGQPIKLGGRAFDVLMALVEARGAVVTRETLIARVWPGRIIEENSLAAQIAALRAAFGAERALIRTVSGRGYQFTGTIHVEPASPGEPVGAVGARPASVSPPTNVPEPVSELIGREEELSEILNLVTMHWLVTLAGAGGIGKTALALALARELRPHFADGVWLAEFSALADPGLVPATMVAAVGIELGGGEASAQRVARALADRRMLLVLDTCEHAITAAAAMAEAMLGAGSGLRIIATSREPLRAGGEWIYPVQPLAVPAMDVAVDDDPLRYGAVRLFIERARAAFCAGPAPYCDDRGDLPAARRHPAGDRAGGGARLSARRFCYFCYFRLQARRSLSGRPASNGGRLSCADSVVARRCRSSRTDRTEQRRGSAHRQSCQLARLRVESWSLPDRALAW